MSFTPAGGGADRSFELVRQSLLQGDDLPFQEALTQWHSLSPQSSRHIPCAVRKSQGTAHGLCLLLSKVSAIGR